VAGRNVAGMLALISTGFSWLACRFRSRTEIELELIALRHQVAILRDYLDSLWQKALADFKIVAEESFSKAKKTGKKGRGRA